MDNLMSENTDHEKIKTCFAQIIAEKIMGKPYYSIMYWQDGDMHIGYSSYDFEYVRQWLSECFDVNALDVAPVVHGKWVERKEHIHLTSEVCKEWTNFYCSACDAPNNVPTEYCPYCGAKMKGDIK